MPRLLTRLMKGCWQTPDGGEVLVNRQVPLVPLKPEDINLAGDLFGRALHDHPLTRHLVPDPARRHRFQRIFRCYIRYGYLYGHVTVPADLTGVVVSIPPGQYAFTLSRLLRIGFLRLPLEFGVSLTHKVWTALTCFERHHQQDMPPRHIYLLAIGVDPPHQSRGIGSALIRTVLDEADRDGHPCYLESTSERNVAFYLNRRPRSISFAYDLNMWKFYGLKALPLPSAHSTAASA